MELDAFERIALVAHSHDLILIGPGDDLELVRQRAGLDHQAVISRRLERVGKAAIDPPAVVMDPRRLAVHDPAGSDDLGAQGMSDALMAQADAQERDPGREPRDDVVRDPGLVRACKARAK